MFPNERGLRMTLTYTLSLLFFIAFSVYIFLGLYILLLNMKSTINRLFFMVTFSLCIWSFAFSMCYLTIDYDTAVNWRMFAAIGWTTMFSFLIHFIMLLTGKSKLLKKRWVYILIYLPAVVFAFVFCLYFNSYGFSSIIHTNFLCLVRYAYVQKNILKAS